MSLTSNISFYFYHYSVLEFDLLAGKHSSTKVIYAFKMEEGCYTLLLYYGKTKKIFPRLD